MIRITNSNKNGNGNGQGEYKPQVEFEYLAADVWCETDEQGNQDVAYTKDVLKALEEDEDSSSTDSNGE